MTNGKVDMESLLKSEDPMKRVAVCIAILQAEQAGELPDGEALTFRRAVYGVLGGAAQEIARDDAIPEAVKLDLGLKILAALPKKGEQAEIPEDLRMFARVMVSLVSSGMKSEIDARQQEIIQEIDDKHCILIAWMKLQTAGLSDASISDQIKALRAGLDSELPDLSARVVLSFATDRVKAGMENDDFFEMLKLFEDDDRASIDLGLTHFRAVSATHAPAQ
jgi:hypothetical protein